MLDVNFKDQISELEKSALKSLKNFTTNFWAGGGGGKYLGRNVSCYGGSFRKILGSCGVQYVHKSAFLKLSLTFLPGNFWTVSDEHGEWFHQEASTMRKQYQGKWNPSMLVDIVGHLEQTLYWQSMAESHPLLHFR